jgi:hypothetical protein
MNSESTKSEFPRIDTTLFVEMEALTPEQRLEWLEGVVNAILEITGGQEIRPDDPAA